ncbi:ataxin-2 homolog isoform X2 [Cherax quadricarinatus]|uniref:ataxin-2 homolog isoform X2 n=1 Tax=Cherax quadricarinatus TaxID=27406 RepID=UPI00387E51E5
MIQEEEPETVRTRALSPQWPPPGHAISRPQGFMGKICTGKGPGGRPVEWPPRPEQEDQDSADQANSMDQVQHHQQTMSQQHQQQQRQQVTSASSEMRTVKQSYQVKQHYETRYTGSQQMGSVQPQQQQSMQHQTTQQTSSTSHHPPVFSKQYQTPSHMTSPPPNFNQVGSPFSQGGPGPQSKFPQQYAPQAAAPPRYAPQAAAPPQYAAQNAAPPQYAAQNAVPPHYAAQNIAPSQYAAQNAAPTQYDTQPQNAPQNIQPQYAPQPAEQFEKGPQPLYQQAPQISAQQQQAAPQTAVQPQTAAQPQKAPRKVTKPQGNAGPPKAEVEFPPGYSTAYSAVHGEWPPKIKNAPNLTTTYPSGFKYREQIPLDNVPAKVVMSQPAFKISQPIRRRGDDKWPPKGVNQPVQEEVREFVKPKKMSRNYGEFFAQNALPHNYAAYRPPPGTQHHDVDEDEEEEEGEEEDAGVSNM